MIRPFCIYFYMEVQYMLFFRMILTTQKDRIGLWGTLEWGTNKGGLFALQHQTVRTTSSFPMAGYPSSQIPKLFANTPFPPLAFS